MQNRVLTKEEIILAYTMLTTPSRGGNIPRPGYYWFYKVIEVTMTKEGRINQYTLSAYYHPHEPNFSAQCLVHSQISSYFNSCSTGPKEIEIGKLLEAVVQVKAITTDEYLFNDEPQLRYKVDWTNYRSKKFQ